MNSARAVSLLLLVSTMFALGGCRSTDRDNDRHRIPVRSLLDVERGSSLAEVESKLGIKGRHEFTARIQTNEFLCVRFSFEDPPGAFYFLLEQGKLKAIVEQPPFEWDTVPWQRPKLVDPEKRILTVLGANDLSGNEIAAVLKDNLSRKGKGTSSLGILPAFIIASPAWLLHAPRIASERNAFIKLKEHFDPFKVKLGAHQDEVITHFGAPARVFPLERDHQMLIFGAPMPPDLPATTLPAWIAVVFESDRVVRVYSDHFFRNDWKP